MFTLPRRAGRSAAAAPPLDPGLGGTRSVADLVKFPGSDDPHEPERWNPRLQLVREILLSREPEVARFPPLLRAYYRLSARSTSWSRKGTVVLHYRF